MEVSLEYNFIVSFNQKIFQAQRVMNSRRNERVGKTWENA